MAEKVMRYESLKGKMLCSHICSFSETWSQFFFVASNSFVNYMEYLNSESFLICIICGLDEYSMHFISRAHQEVKKCRADGEVSSVSITHFKKRN